MKKLLTILIVGIVILSTIPSISYASEVSVYVDGEKLSFDVPPNIISGRTFVPMRGIFEALGANVEWYPDEQCVLGTMCGIGVELYIGNTTIYINTVPKSIDAAPFIDNGRTFVPVRFVAESLGATVIYDETTNSVMIKSPQNLGKLTYPLSGNIRYLGQFDTTGTYPSGYGTTWTEDGIIKHTGEYKFGLYNGYGCLYENGYAYYIGEFASGYPTNNGEYVNRTVVLPGENTTNSNTFNSSSNDSDAQYIELQNWYNAQLKEISDYERNCDPYTTERAFEIYNKYEINPYSAHIIPYEKFMSFSSSNEAMRYAQNLKNRADAEILAEHQAYIKNWKLSVEDEYQAELAILNRKK